MVPPGAQPSRQSATVSRLLYNTLTCACIDLGRPRQPLQKIDGFQHTHPRGRLRFHPLPGNRSESGRPASGDVLERGAGLWPAVLIQPGARHHHPERAQGLRGLLRVHGEAEGAARPIARLRPDSQTRYGAA